MTERQAWEVVASMRPKRWPGLCSRVEILYYREQLSDRQFINMKHKIYTEMNAAFSRGEIAPCDLYRWSLDKEGNRKRREWARARAKECRR